MIVHRFWPPRAPRHLAETREKSAIAATLDEAKRGVAEGRGDRERLQRAALVSVRLDVADRRRAAAVEQREGALGVGHAKGERAHAVRVLLQKAIRAAALTHGRRADHDVVAGAKRARALTAAFTERFTALGDLREVHAVDVEARAALQVAHVVVHTFEAEDPERFELCHLFKVRLFTAAPAGPGRYSRSGLSVWVRCGKSVQLQALGLDAEQASGKPRATAPKRRAA